VRFFTRIARAGQHRQARILREPLIRQRKLAHHKHRSALRWNAPRIETRGAQSRRDLPLRFLTHGLSISHARPRLNLRRGSPAVYRDSRCFGSGSQALEVRLPLDLDCPCRTPTCYTDCFPRGGPVSANCRSHLLRLVLLGRRRAAPLLATERGRASNARGRANRQRIHKSNARPIAASAPGHHRRRAQPANLCDHRGIRATRGIRNRIWT